MAIDDQIRDKKQYDINREAAKILALSSGKIRAFEYLTGENILPSNQNRTSKIHLFSFGKSFWKTNKKQLNIKEKKKKAIQDQRQVKTVKKYGYDSEDTSFISKQKEIFKKLVGERREKITDLDRKGNSDDLICRYKGNTADVKFDKFDNALGIRDGKTDLADVKNNQQKFESYLGEIEKGSNKHKSKEQKNTL